MYYLIKNDTEWNKQYKAKQNADVLENKGFDLPQSSRLPPINLVK